MNRAVAHRVYFSDLNGVGPGSVLSIGGEEANHAARVKRVRPGEAVGLFDGRGLVAFGSVVRAESGKRALLEISVEGVERWAPVAPRVEVWCPPPKGDRLDTMIEQLSQLGVGAWRPLRTARSERDAFRMDKLERVAVESAKQCGRAWLLEVGDWASFEHAIADPRAVLADASGEPGHATDAGTVLLLGPEGGWTAGELEQARGAGRSVVRFGPHVMRIETAAVGGAACLLSDAIQTKGAQ